MRSSSRVVAAIAASLLALPALAQSPPPVGELVDIGARRLHLHCTGTGSPAVVVENGDGAFSIDWWLVQPTVAKRTKICTYDRAGYAWSDRAPILDMVATVAGDLHLLLRSAKVAPPYVMVGASMGGIYVRAYQRRFPEEVAAIVLVDATHDEGLAYVIDGNEKPISLVTAEELRTFMNRLVERNPPLPNVPAKVSEPFDRLPTPLQVTRLWCTAKFFSSIDMKQLPYSAEANREEFVALRRQRLEHEHPLGNLPLLVLARTIGTDEHRRELQSQLAALSTRGKLVMAPNSGHEIHLYRPDLVIDAIDEMVSAVRRQ